MGLLQSEFFPSFRVGQTHGAPYRGYGYVPLRYGEGGGVVRIMGTQKRVFVLLFSFSIFSDRLPLKLENEKTARKLGLQKVDHRNSTYGIIWTHERPLVRQGKQVIRIPAIEVLLYRGKNNTTPIGKSKKRDKASVTD